MNSFRAVANAIEYEIKRQGKALDDSEKLVSETRGWVDDKGITVSQRSKEESQDYRYFPEPDLPMLHFTKEYLDELRRELPELPDKRKVRFIDQFGLPEKDAETLVNYKELSEYFEEVVSEFDEWLEIEKSQDRSKLVKMAANWTISQFLALLNEKNILPVDSKITQENFAELIKLIGQGKVSQLGAKDVFAKMFETGEDPSNILENLDLGQISDEVKISEVVKIIIRNNPKAVEDAKINPRAVSSIVGGVMKELKGKGNPHLINEIIKKELGI
jgi:aspartyl-tRNA(Asn)/glutamyl-tRNA(Gln) amidotransferase subunit B